MSRSIKNLDFFINLHRSIAFLFVKEAYTKASFRMLQDMLSWLTILEETRGLILHETSLNSSTWLGIGRCKRVFSYSSVFKLTSLCLIAIDLIEVRSLHDFIIIAVYVSLSPFCVKLNWLTQFGRVLNAIASDLHRPVFSVYSVSNSFRSKILKSIGKARTWPLTHSWKN